MSPTIAPKQAPAESLEDVIASRRYALRQQIGQGTWGTVFAAHDNIRDQDVAIKVMTPNSTAKAQMAHRNLTEFRAAQKEGGQLMAAAHVVPRWFEIDDDGRPFIVMPLYRQFMHDALEQAKTETMHGGRFTPTNLTIDKVIRYAQDIASGLSEIHHYLRRAHGDLKFDNIAIDDADGRALISDLGTSTCATIGQSVSPRDNMGHLYSRSPTLFMDNTHPTFNSDIYSFGTLLYALFEGKAPMQDEIDKAQQTGGEPAVRLFMEQFSQRTNFGYIRNHLKLREFMKDKMKESSIPSQFQDIILNSMLDNIHNGRELTKKLEMKVDEYRHAQAKAEVKREWLTKYRNNFLGALATTSTIAGGIIGLSWLAFSAYVGPDWSRQTDTDTKLSLRSYDKSEIRLQLEDLPHTDALFDVDPNNTLVARHREEYKKGVLIDKLTEEWILAMEETNTGTSSMRECWPYDHQMRAHHLTQGREISIDGIALLNDYIRTLIRHGLMAADGQNNGVIDFEDATMITLVGPKKLYAMQKATGSTQYDIYSTAHDDSGIPMLSEGSRRFLGRYFTRVRENLPQVVQPIRDSSLSVSGGIFPAHN